MSRIKKSLFFVINPISGSGGGLKARRTIERCIDRDKYDVEFEITAGSGHARQIAEQAVCNGADIVAAVGGDGTVNEIASSLVGTDTALAIIPVGSGNGLALHLGISKNPEKAVGIINGGHLRVIDSATFNGHPFFCTAGVGYDAKVAMDYARDGHRGLITYARHAIADWVNYVPQSYRIEADDRTFDTKALLITAGNADQWGNNFHITPGAKIDDGLLSLTIVHPVNVIQAIPMMPELMAHSIERNVHVTTLSARKVTISRNSEAEAHYDGEPVTAGKEIRLECIPSSLKVITLV